eukprot:CAMPEP_0184541692 /NCGR_PEP_ID=MMETSP0199_2-20130426/1532_1 /TAXON_ID=1112570 /ORGANISM="Thraustochytrium sp., Strain LLF1b" /LENGTH=432 /DNA_ID=CAMNT_0026935429 /DNA_START=268 /DNA_END=1566 /DNA_ORIENTATION=+
MALTWTAWAPSEPWAIPEKAGDEDDATTNQTALQVGYCPFTKTGHELDGPDGSGYPLSDILVCNSCSSVLPKDPMYVVTELDSFYCPQNLEDLVPTSKAFENGLRSSKAFQCPICTNCLAFKERLAVNGSKEKGASLDEPDLYLYCEHCRWNSRDISLTDSSIGALCDLAQEQEKAREFIGQNLVSSLTSHYRKVELSWLPAEKPAVKNKSEWEDSWYWHDCELVSQKKRDKLFTTEARPPVVEEMYARSRIAEEEAPFPKRFALRTKQTIRCRECVASDQQNILVKPQLLPLIGDSTSLKQKGAWFTKKVLGFDLLPRISARIVSNEVWLCVTNPRLDPISLRVANCPWFEVEEYEEIKEIDLFSSPAPPAGNPPSASDPPIIRERLHSKVLLALPLPERWPLHLDVAFFETDQGEESKTAFKLVIEHAKR